MPGGRFVFSLCHPCFNTNGSIHCVEDATVNGDIVTTYALKTTTYLHSGPTKGVALIGQPVSQYYFDRPLHILFNACQMEKAEFCCFIPAWLQFIRI